MIRMVLAALLLTGALALLQACGGSDDAESSSSTRIDNIRDHPALELYDDDSTTAGQTHVPPTVSVPYDTVPPYGGPHDSRPLPCGVYTSAPRFENAVHAMEHGAVVVWYSPRLLDADEHAELNELMRRQLEDGLYGVLAPYEAMSVPLILVTWGTRLPLNNVDTTLIEAYIDEFKHDAPEPTAAGGCPTAS